MGATLGLSEKQLASKWRLVNTLRVRFRRYRNLSANDGEMPEFALNKNRAKAKKWPFAAIVMAASIPVPGTGLVVGSLIARVANIPLGQAFKWVSVSNIAFGILYAMLGIWRLSYHLHFLHWR